MKINRQLLVIISTSIIICAGGLLAAIPMLQKPTAPAHAAEAFPSQYFAPYEEPGVGDSLPSINQQTGQKYFTLAFMIANGCQATWGSDGSNVSSDIQALRNQGGDVIISFGGASGQELAQACPDASSLQDQYQSVINQYQVRHLDFDIEGGNEGDSTTYDRRNAALAALQQANPGLSISFTLPASPNGLENASIGLLNNAVSHGVNISVVNLMTMDYNSGNIEMGQAAISAANALYSQLQQIYPSKSPSQIWSMVGITPMIGKNDRNSDGSFETFTTDDANAVLAFAQSNNIGELSFWAISRDNGSCSDWNSDSSSDTCSGISQNPYDFTNIFKAFTGNSNNGGGSNVPVTPTATASPTPVVNLAQSNKDASDPTASDPNWTSVWKEDFTEGTIDNSKWTIRDYPAGQFNNEQECYSNDGIHTRIDGSGQNSHLVLEATQASGGACPYISGRLDTQGKYLVQPPTNGKPVRVEASIQLPQGGNGIWPAFWMLGQNIDTVGWPNCGEIDIMENSGLRNMSAGTIQGTIHSAGGSSDYGQYTLPGGNFSDGYHIFAMDWYTDHIVLSVDGNAYKTIDTSQLGGDQVFNQPFYILLNLAVGGGWSGNVDNSTPFPQQMNVNFVRVYQHN